MSLAREFMDNILVLQHTVAEKLGTIEHAIRSHGMSFSYIRPFMGEPIPKTIADAPALVVMGGPMGVYENKYYPYLQDEMRLIEEAMRFDKPVLGICLGSQLIAAVLGSSIYKGVKKEIGWYSVSVKPAGLQDKLFKDIPRSFIPFHWHGDVFDLPSDTLSLAYSNLTEHQAFLYGDRVYGLLFHLEVTKDLITGMVSDFSKELENEGLDGAGILAKATKKLASLSRIEQTLFDRWAGYVLSLSVSSSR